MSRKPNADDIIGLYERHAGAWDAQRGRGLAEKRWLDPFAALLPPGGTVLDVGCGSGEPVARYLIAQGFPVTGIDASGTLIGLCRDRFPRQEWIVADMRTLDLGRRFDGIIAWDSLFHLTPEDQRRMFPVFAKHAAPETALLFTSGPAHGESIGLWQDEPLYHASLDASEYHRLLTRAGFGVLSHGVEDPDCGGHTVWLARRIPGTARAPRV